ncbi:MAG: hypothetical protein N4A72_01265 [Bacteroidales bacterium]|jgi:hypothetical protein|nr:hypothetical protein [Bacteroidales bacterium]
METRNLILSGIMMLFITTSYATSISNYDEAKSPVTFVISNTPPSLPYILNNNTDADISGWISVLETDFQFEKEMSIEPWMINHEETLIEDPELTLEPWMINHEETLIEDEPLVLEQWMIDWKR